MWTATITKKDFDKGRLRVFVDFTDGNRTTEEEFSLKTGNELNALVQNRLSELESLSAAETAISEGVFTPSNPPSVPQSVLSAALSDLSRIKNLIDLGVIDKASSEAVNALNAAKQAYQNG